jgi:hypothetical protein
MFRTRTTWTSPFQPRCWIRSITLLLLLISLLPVAALAQLGEPCPAGTVTRSDITTYHNDTQRTGWNKLETALKPCNVDPRSFGLLATLKDINGQIDAQPLIVTNQEIELAQGVRKLYDIVVYVATSTNSVYAICLRGFCQFLRFSRRRHAWLGLGLADQEFSETLRSESIE